MRLGNSWGIRRSVLEDFLERVEHSATLFGRLRSIYRVPDNVLAITQTHAMVFQLGAAFFAAGEVRGEKLVKFHEPRTEASVE